MNEKAAKALEWPRFLTYAEAEARTEPGKARIRELALPAVWAADPQTARALQAETQEMLALLDRDALWGPLTELRDPTPIVENLRRGGVLEVADLALLRAWLYAIDSWVQTPRDELRGERFRKALTGLSDPFNEIRVLERVLTPEGELSEKASPRLAAIHQEIRALRREIGIVLDQLLKTFAQKGVIQENFSDIRDGRYVIPIKISSQNEVEGIIYEASASRQTVFVEPKEVSPLNNRLRQRQNDLVQEIYAVLLETSTKLHPFAEDLARSVGIVAHWDSMQARARLGSHYGGKAITVSEERAFELRQSAHPLLWWSLKPEQIIRNQVEFGEPVRTLLLTGPNTGGKTVLLKTLGIAGICARTGFPFPGTDHPTVPFLDRFFADLGDPQSIEEHLSSFSGHVLRFKEILDHVTPNSLVLIDELNSATDPEEGAALGRAFLETVMARGALIVSTTHDPHLKALAVSDERILNASMEFDEGSRTPTFRMALGVPGRSRALETAERLGLPPDVLRLARTYLSREHLEFERVLSQLESDVQEAARARKEAVHARDEAERLRKEWTARTEAGVKEMMDRTRQKLRHILEQAQDEVRSSVQKLDELKNRKELDHTRSRLNSAFGLAANRLESALSEEAPEIAEALHLEKSREPVAAEARAELKAGTAVRIPKWKSTGTVIEITGTKAKVAMGTIQMSLALADIEPLAPSELAALPKAKPKSPEKVKTTFADTVAVPPSQIDLRGIRFEEAMSQLEAYLDQAYRSGGLAEVTVVHGLGTGALREGSHKLLRELPYIKEFRDAGAGRGGTGATLVEFDRD